jgi:hypothetical protein
MFCNTPFAHYTCRTYLDVTMDHQTATALMSLRGTGDLSRSSKRSSCMLQQLLSDHACRRKKYRDARFRFLSLFSQWIFDGPQGMREWETLATLVFICTKHQEGDPGLGRGESTRLWFSFLLLLELLLSSYSCCARLPAYILNLDSHAHLATLSTHPL